MFNNNNPEVVVLVKIDDRKIALRISEVVSLEEGLNKDESYINFKNNEGVSVKHKFTELYDLFFKK